MVLAQLMTDKYCDKNKQALYEVNSLAGSSAILHSNVSMPVDSNASLRRQLQLIFGAFIVFV